MRLVELDLSEFLLYPSQGSLKILHTNLFKTEIFVELQDKEHLFGKPAQTQIQAQMQNQVQYTVTKITLRCNILRLKIIIKAGIHHLPAPPVGSRTSLQRGTI